MLNRQHFTVLAGRPEGWEVDARRRINDGEPPLQVLVDHQHRGRQSAELVRGYRGGWGIRSGCHMLLATTHTKEDALAWGLLWAEQDPTNREFYVRKKWL